MEKENSLLQYEINNLFGNNESARNHQLMEERPNVQFKNLIQKEIDLQEQWKAKIKEEKERLLQTMNLVIKMKKHERIDSSWNMYKLS